MSHVIQNIILLNIVLNIICRKILKMLMLNAEARFLDVLGYDIKNSIEKFNIEKCTKISNLDLLRVTNNYPYKF